MTIGIYKLKFNGTDKVYIGQSKSSIERRFTNHLYAIKQRFASKKLQTAYYEYGMPNLDIIMESEPEELDELEAEAILIYDSIENGFNTLPGGSAGNGQYGDTASNSKYDNNIYCHILKLLSLDVPSTKIVAELEVTDSIVASIRKCENHKWLKDVLPEEYAIVSLKHSNYSPKNNRKKGKSTTIIELLTGKQHEIISLRESARQLSLDCGNLSKLLSGKVDSYKGFVLVTNVNKVASKYVKDPSGTIHEIPYRGLSAFAAAHGLSKSMLSNLLNKKRTEYNEWTLHEVL